MKWTTVSADWKAAPGSSVNIGGLVDTVQPSGLEQKAEAFTISCYENEIPPFVDYAMDRLYGSIFSSVKQFKIYHVLGHGTHTYVARRGAKIDTVLLFECSNGVVRVLNEVIKLDAQQIERFVQFVFKRFKAANVVCYKSIQTEAGRFAYPFQKINFSEDIVLELPATVEEYHSRLGKNTRRNIKRYGDKLRRSFPSFSFRVYEQSEASDQDVRDIIMLNHARMAEKNKTSMIDEIEAQRIIELVKRCGLVGVATIDGRVCAGTIGYWAGEHFYLSVVAHDPDYDEFWLGILCCYNTIKECIARHAKEFHFLWGRYEYKFTLLGVKRDLDMLIVYRSPLQALLHADMYAKAALDGLRRRLNLWLHDAARHESAVSRVGVKAVMLAREIKQTIKCIGTGKCHEAWLQLFSQKNKQR